MKKTVIVVGSMRSGTSMVAGILSKIGVDMGEDAWEKSRANPTGYFEDGDFYQLNQEILEKAGGDQRNPPTRKDIISEKNSFNDEIKKLISKKEGELWGWKDPRSTLTIELFIDHIENPYIIICNRDFNDVVSSYSEMSGLGREKSEEVTERYLEGVKNVRENLSMYKNMEIEYSKVVDKPRKNVDKIVSFLGLNLNSKKKREAYNHVKKRRYLRVLKVRRLIEKGIREPYNIPGYVSKRVRHLFRSIT